MFDREKNLFDSYAAKRISRRELLDGAAKLGVAGVAANAAFASSVSQAMAADFNWKGQAGKIDQAAAEQAPLCRRDDRRSRGVQVADWDERHL